MLIAWLLSSICLSQADNPDRIATNGEHPGVQLFPDQTQGDKPFLSVVLTSVGPDQRSKGTDLFKPKKYDPLITFGGIG